MELKPRTTAQHVVAGARPRPAPFAEIAGFARYLVAPRRSRGPLPRAAGSEAAQLATAVGSSGASRV